MPAVAPAARSRWCALPVALWAALVLAALYARPYLPIDETRYVSIAWEMWRDGAILVPLKNGAPYADKPPLLFWVIALGWKLLGVNEWWPRVAVPLFALLSLGLTARLAYRLWPRQDGTPAGAACVLGACLLWAVFTAAVNFDTVLTSCVLAALLGLLAAARDGGWRGWAGYGVAIGLGILAKGPVILLHVLPVALAAPWWLRPAHGGWLRWYLGVLLGVALGAAIGLAWAIPAAHAGGERYAYELLWGKWGGRVVESIAHPRSIWWYLPLLPLLALPWTLWPPLWRGARALAGSPPDMGLRFLAAWLAPAFLAFSLVSGKQVHYLLPLVPGLAVLVARAGAADGRAPARADQLPFAAALCALAALLAFGPGFSDPRYFLAGEESTLRLTAVALTAIAAALAASRFAAHGQSVFALSAAAVAAVVAIHLGPVRAIAFAYDVAPTARLLGQLQAQGRPIAHVGAYNDQFHFHGRLTRPLQEIDAPEAIAWARANRDGVVVDYADRDCPGTRARPIFAHRYRGKMACVYAAAALAP